MSENQTENLKKLFALMQERPELPIIPVVDGEIASKDYGYWLGKWGTFSIDKYLIHKDNKVIFYEEADFDMVSIFEKYFDYNECGIDENAPDEQILPLMREKIDTLDWKEAIIVYIDLPEGI